ECGPFSGRDRGTVQHSRRHERINFPPVLYVSLVLFVRQFHSDFRGMCWVGRSLQVPQCATDTECALTLSQNGRVHRRGRTSLQTRKNRDSILNSLCLARISVIAVLQSGTLDRIPHSHLCRGRILLLPASIEARSAHAGQLTHSLKSIWL